MPKKKISPKKESGKELKESTKSTKGKKKKVYDPSKDPQYDGSTKLLHPKQEVFCNEYLIDLNGAAAARRAGYSEKCARQQAVQNLAKHYIHTRMEYLMKQRARNLKIDQTWVFKNLMEVVGRCLEKQPVLEFDYDEKKLVQKVDEESGLGVWQFDSHGANKAMETLLKHMGDPEKDAPIQINTVTFNEIQSTHKPDDTE